MIEQQGRVSSFEAGRASITFESVAGCPACAAGKGCGAGVFGRLTRRKPMLLVLDGQSGLEPGQAVVVGIPEALFLRLLLQLYLAPVLAGLAGAALGHYLAVLLALQGFAQDLIALTGALILAVATLHSQRTGKGRAAMEYPVQLLHIPETARAAEFRQNCQPAGE
jgi:positive regulator of sigma E activity